jgi:hypothetical protein
LRGMVASRAEVTDGGLDWRKGTRKSKVGRRKRKVRRFWRCPFLPDLPYPATMQQPTLSGAKMSAITDI